MTITPKKKIDILLIAVSVFMLMIIPFASDNEMLYPTQYGQLFFLLSCSLLIASILCFYSFFFQKHIFKEITIIDGLFLLLFLYTGIHTLAIVGKNPPIEFWGIVSLIPIYLSIRLLDVKYLPILIFVLMIAGIGQGIYGTLQLHDILPSNHNLFKTTGGFFNSAPYSGYLISIFPIALGVCLFKVELFGKKFSTSYIISIIAISSIICILPSTSSRAAWIGVIVSTTYLVNIRYNIIFLIKSHLQLKSWKIPFFTCLSIILIVGVSTLYNMKRSSADGRVLIWKTTMNMIADKPILGIGFGKFKAEYMKYQANYLCDNINKNESLLATESIEYPFNEFLHVISEFGLVGISIILSIFYVVFFKIKSTYEQVELIYVHIFRSVFLALIIFSCFSYPLEIWPILLNGVVFLAIFNKFIDLPKLSRPSFKSLLPKTKIIIFIISVLLMIVIPFVWYQLQKEKKAYKYWKSASVLYNGQDYDLSTINYGNAYQSLFNNGLFLEHYGKSLIMSGRYSEALKILKQSLSYRCDPIAYTDLGDCYDALGDFKLAERMYLDASMMMPSHFYPQYLLVKLYLKTARNEMAIQRAKVILNMPITTPSPAISQIKKEMEELAKSKNETNGNKF